MLTKVVINGSKEWMSDRLGFQSLGRVNIIDMDNLRVPLGIGLHLGCVNKS